MEIPLKSVIFSILLYFPVCAEGVETLEKSSLEVQCQSDKQCDEMGMGGYICTENVCVCPSHNCQETNVEVNIVPVAKLDGTCSTTSQCLVANSFCSKKEKCECLRNTVASLDKRSCFNVSTYESPCEENAQCAGFNGVCLDKNCSCDTNKQLINNICYNIAELGSACQKNEECFSTNFSTCKDNKCTCLINYVRSSSKSECLPKAKSVQSRCSEDNQCSSVLGAGAFCSSGFCKCMELYQFKKNSNTCVPDTLLGGKCSKHEECHQPGDGDRRLECILGECKCKSLYTEKSGFCILNSGEGSFESHSISKLYPYILSYILFLTIF